MPAACRQGSLTSEIYVTLAEHRCRQANPKLPDDRQVVLMFTPEWAPMCGFYITVPASCVCVNVNVNGYEKPLAFAMLQAGWGQCGQSWMQGYCNASCGRCSSYCTDISPPGTSYSCTEQVSTVCMQWLA